MGQINVERMGSLKEADTAEYAAKRMEASWEKFKNREGKNNLFWSIFYAFRREYTSSFLLGFIISAIELSFPFFIKGLIDFISNPGESNWKGFGLIIGLTICQIIATLLQEQISFYQRMIGVKSSNGLISMLYKKQLRTSNATNKLFSQGEIVNFVQVDASKLQLFTQYLPEVAKIPFVMTVCIIFLFYYLKASFIIGILIFIIAFFCNLFISKLSARQQKEYMNKQDARVNVTTESLNNIKMLKLYSWIDYFSKAIADRRAEELKIQKLKFQLGVVNVSLYYFFPQILSVAVFSVYIGFGNTLELSIAYTVMTFFNILKGPLRFLPQFIGHMIEFLIAMKRIELFMLCQEVNPTVVHRMDYETTQNAVEIMSGNMFWGVKSWRDEQEKAKTKKQKKPKKKGKKNQEVEEEKKQDPSQEENEKRNFGSLMAVKDMSVSIKHGEFVCIIGDVGSGKSSLLSAIIGDLLYAGMPFLLSRGSSAIAPSEENQSNIDEIIAHTQERLEPVEAPIRIANKIAYVQQNPWIQNKTIRENILFGLPYDEVKYQETIEICELERDLEILPAGDQTEIGEKGINLSGGQKARVSLARAVYSDQDLILMDDPISALDANVKKKIFLNVFLKKFKDKTRVLVTHAVDFLHLVDNIILLKHGRVLLHGSYQDLKDSPYLKEVISIHKSNQDHNQSAKPKSEKKEEEEPKGDTIQEEEKEVERKGSDVSLSDLQENLSSFDNEGEDSQSESDSDSQSESEDEDPQHKKERRKERKARSYSITAISASPSGKMIEDENKEETKVTFAVYKEFLGYYGGWKVIFCSQLTLVSFSIFKILSDYWVGSWAYAYDQQSRFGFYCGLSFMFAIICCICVMFRCMTFLFFNLWATKRLHEVMIHKIFRAPINLYFDITPIGRILNKFSKDLNTVETQLGYYFSSLFQLMYLGLTSLIVATCAVYWVIFLIPVLFYIAGLLYKKMIGAYRETARVESVTKSPLLSFLAETSAGTSTIRAFNKQQEFINENNRLLNKNIVACMMQQAVGSWLTLRLFFIFIIMFFFCTCFCIVYRDSGNAVMMGLMLTYLLVLQDVSIGVVQLLAAAEQKMVNVDRCLKLTHIIQEDYQAAEPYQNFLEKTAEWPSEGKVEFQNVSLQYRPTTELVLRDLSFEVKGGEKIGVVGRTGAGKSTICLSLSRIVEIVQGQILIDGVDIKQLNISDVRARITVIPQDPTMFTGTLKFNLDPEGSVEKERMEALLRRAKLGNVLDKDEKGLDQEITENGSNLSSGEKQLICICRAILRRSKVVVLDEATANIDIVTEQKIQELIQTEFAQSTMITIAHRLNTIINSDRVLVLSYGKIKEYDSPTHLMENQSSEFSKLLKDLQKEEAKNQGAPQ